MDEWPTATHDRLVKAAAVDLAREDQVVPTLVAHRGEEELLTAGLRPFPSGAYHDPILELAALAVPLGANRLVLSMAGRAWSLDDPIVPVSADGDLRQRIVLITVADGTSGSARLRTTLHPFELHRPHGGVGGPPRASVRWGRPRTIDGGEGWIASALAVFVTGPPLTADREEIRRQAARVRNLGHELVLRPEVRARLRRRQASSR